jgi:hypothetical protein
MTSTKEQPILFSAPMVRAILEGRKVQTRRVMKPQPGDDWNPEVGICAYEWKGSGEPGPDFFGAGDEDECYKCPYGAPGDRLWVRETFCPVYHGSYEPLPKGRMPTSEHEAVIVYRTTPAADEYDGHWRPSIFMPRWPSRITLEITEVRVQRVQEISEEDAVAEGTGQWAMETNAILTCETMRDAYRKLWDSINIKKYPWESNPWVWALSFRRGTL